MKLYGIWRHEDPIQDCLEWLVRCGSLVFIDASNLIDEKAAKKAR